MDKNYTISQLAKAVGVPATTLRYYERVGLLRPEHRSQGNYRLYTKQSLHRLKFIRAAQAIGFTLQDVKTLLGMESGDAQSCAEVQAVSPLSAMTAGRLMGYGNSLLRVCRKVAKVAGSAMNACRPPEIPWSSIEFAH